ncbi:MAG: hypothetical protein RIR65_2879 [Planctomycetota bacterium]
MDAPSTGTAAARPTPRTILLVDNDPDLRRALRLRLEARGYAVREAGTGAQALAVLEQSRCDLLVSDINMPCGDGLALADAVAARWRVPVIFMTGFRDLYALDKLAPGATAILEKPFDFEVLADLMASALVGLEDDDDHRLMDFLR